MKRKRRINSLYAKEIAAVVLLLAVTMFLGSYGEFVETGYATFGNSFEILSKNAVPGSGAVIIRLTTSDYGNCKISQTMYQTTVPYSTMTSSAPETSGRSHVFMLNSLTTGTKTYYIYCAPSSLIAIIRDSITFTISSAGDSNAKITVDGSNKDAATTTSDTTAPVITDYDPKADVTRRTNLAVVSVIMNVTTNEPATCGYSATADGVLQEELPSGLYHEWTLRLGAGSKNYYVKCKDAAGNEARRQITFNLDIRTLDVRDCRLTEPSGQGVSTGLGTYSGSSPLSWSYDASASESTPCKWKCTEGFRQRDAESCEAIPVGEEFRVTATAPQSVATNSVDISVTTNADARCKISAIDRSHGVQYSDIQSVVPESPLARTHIFSLSGLRNREYTYYIYCSQTGSSSVGRAVVGFTVNSASNDNPGVTSASELKENFGVPWNVFSSDRQWAIKVMPNPAVKTGSKVRITVEARGEYVRKDFYIFDYSTKRWKKYFFDGQILERNNNWLVNGGRKELELGTGMLAAGKNFVATATCNKDLSNRLWCGCRAGGDCNKWQLQTFGVNAVLPTESIDTEQLVEYLKATESGRLFLRRGICTECVAPSTTAARADFDNSGKVDFDDFFAFGDAFGTRSGESGFNAKFDLNSDSKVDFNDFFAFADQFGQAVSGTYTCGETAPSGSDKVIGAPTYTGGYSYTSWTYSDDATATTPCKWKCASGYARDPNNPDACIATTAACTDSDGGKNYDVKGIVNNDIDDSCVASPVNALMEFYCVTQENMDLDKVADIDYNRFLRVEDHVCPNGCENGACKPGTGAPAVVEVATLNQYSTLSGRVTDSSLGLVTGGSATTASGLSIGYNTYIDLTSPATGDYELVFDDMRAQLTTRQLNIGQLPSVASSDAYLYKSAIEFSAPIEPAELAGAHLNIIGTNYIVLSASTSSITLVRDGKRISIKGGESADETISGRQYNIMPLLISADRADVRVKYNDAPLTPKSAPAANSAIISVNGFDEFPVTGVKLGVARTSFVSSSDQERNSVIVVIGQDIFSITENSATSNPGYFVDINADEQGRITKIVVYVAKSNEGKNYLIASEKFTDPFWKSFKLVMEAVGDTQAKIKIEKIA